MQNVKLLLVLGMFGLVTAGCGERDNEETADPSTAETVVASTQSTDSEQAISEEPGLDELEQEVQEEIEKIGSEEEINWDNVHLNKRQYEEYIASLSDDQSQAEENGEEALEVVSSKMLDDRTIEIVINNTDSSEMSELTNQLFALVMDSFSRQLYLHSDYSNGTDQPTIIIKESSGNVISEATDFIETE